jgi:Kef-type K+ transport system membrane component KefB
MTGLTFLILFLFLMALIAFFPRLLRRFNIPSVIAIMLIGIIIGPNMLNVMHFMNQLLGRGYPTEDIYIVIETIGLIGLIFLMSLAGMESNLRIIQSEKKAVFWLSTLTFFIPAMTGLLVFKHFRPDDFIGQLFYASLFASHSVGIVFPIIKELKVVKTRFGVAVLASTVITDLASLILLAFCVQLVRQKTNVVLKETISIFDKINMSNLGIFFYPLFIFSIFLFIFLSLWLVPKISRWIFNRTHSNDESRITVFLITVFSIVLLGELIGVNVIVGAFIAGMALSNLRHLYADNKILFKKIEGTGYGIFIPFMFLSIGMKTNITVLLTSLENINIIMWTVIGLVGSKIFSGWLAMRLSGFTHIKGLLAGLMTVPQLSATLAAAAVGFSLKIIPVNFFNAIIVLSIVTTIPVPILVKSIIIKAKVKFNNVEDALSAIMDDEIDDELL